MGKDWRLKLLEFVRCGRWMHQFLRSVSYNHAPWDFLLKIRKSTIDRWQGDESDHKDDLAIDWCVLLHSFRKPKHIDPLLRNSYHKLTPSIPKNQNPQTSPSRHYLNSETSACSLYTSASQSTYQSIISPKVPQVISDLFSCERSPSHHPATIQSPACYDAPKASFRTPPKASSHPNVSGEKRARAHHSQSQSRCHCRQDL
jgi:hypothetical protein